MNNDNEARHNELLRRCMATINELKNRNAYLSAKSAGEHMVFVTVQEENRKLQVENKELKGFAEIGKMFVDVMANQGENCPLIDFFEGCDNCIFDKVCDKVVRKIEGSSKDESEGITDV